MCIKSQHRATASHSTSCSTTELLPFAFYVAMQDLYCDWLKWLPEGSTVGRVLNALFNDCVLGKGGQTTNPMIQIAKVDPVPYYGMRTRLCLRIY